MDVEKQQHNLTRTKKRYRNLAQVSFSGGCSDDYSRNDFPEGFVFGSAISAFQWEGAADEDGRTPSILDTMAHSRNGSRALIACDGYHKYKEDVRLMYDMGLDAFRLSISWSRLIPSGRGPVNPKGLLFYKNLIQELKRHGIEPHVTLYHDDLPQALEDEYGGWLDRKIINDFTAYADVCFREFGDTVKFWSTINEPNMLALIDVLPWGLEGVLEYIKQNYGNPPVYILENGRPTNHHSSLNDVGRVEYLHAYIAAVLNSVRNGSSTKGYFQWSFMDLFEFIDPNYTYGLYYVNFSDPELKRSPKTSALWYSCFLNGTTICLQELKNISVSSSPGFSSS
ncbi:Beta-glucosidase 8 [Raphanus sativus]|nr:Beta-glucosidase 8 [Raphanus sativus]